jgi:predicted nucleotidyltransferase
MDKIPAEIRNILQVFLDKLSESNIRIEKAFLFGSYAKKSNNELSDIDIALVSRDFTGNQYLDNEMIREAKLAASYSIEAHTFTVEEFESGNPFISEILSYGISIN